MTKPRKPRGCKLRRRNGARVNFVPGHGNIICISEPQGDYVFVEGDEGRKLHAWLGRYLAWVDGKGE
jgi:hypothetical protein